MDRLLEQLAVHRAWYPKVLVSNPAISTKHITCLSPAVGMDVNQPLENDLARFAGTLRFSRGSSQPTVACFKADHFW